MVENFAIRSSVSVVIVVDQHCPVFVCYRNVFDKRNFLEEEAELSGSDVGSDEDEDIDTDDDVLDEDSGGEELPSEEELHKQINKADM